MKPKIGQVYHISDEGWSIVSDIKLDRVKFYTLEFFDDEPREFYVPFETLDKKPARLSGVCLTKHLKKSEMFNIRPGDNVFFVSYAGALEYGRVSSIVREKLNVVLNTKDGYFNSRPWEVLSFHHSFIPVEGTTTERCELCGAIYAPSKPKVRIDNANKNRL